MGCQLLTTWPKLCHGTPVLDHKLMASLEPEVGQDWRGEKKVISPDHPYAAASARNAIYFIDQRFELESALKIKEQLENLVPSGNGHWCIDEIDATAERRDINGNTVFKFNPAYARIFFAQSMNARNPALNLSVHEPAGDWLVVYDIKNTEVGARAKRIGTGLTPRVHDAMSLFWKRDDCRDGGLVDAVELVSILERRKAAVDTPRFEGESDAEYYQRMDQLHWH